MIDCRKLFHSLNIKKHLFKIKNCLNKKKEYKLFSVFSKKKNLIYDFYIKRLDK